MFRLLLLVAGKSKTGAVSPTTGADMLIQLLQKNWFLIDRFMALVYMALVSSQASVAALLIDEKLLN